MFKKYIDNHPDSKISYIYNTYFTCRKNIENAQEKLFLWAGVCVCSFPLFGIAVTYYLNSLAQIFWMLSGPFIMLYVVYMIIKTEKLQNKMFNDCIESINEKTQSEEDLLELLEELKNTQNNLQLVSIEKMISDLKFSYIKNGKLDESIIKELYYTILNNYDSVQSSTVINDKNKALFNNFYNLQEIEIGKTTVQKIL